MVQTVLAQEFADKLNEIYRNLFCAFNHIEGLRVAGGFQELVPRPKGESVEVEVARNPIGPLVMWIGSETFNGKSIGINTRKATLKFHD